MLSVVRTLIVTGVLAGVVMTVFWQLLGHTQRQAIRELEALNAEMAERLAARQAMIDRLSVSRRVAHVRVLEQEMDLSGEVLGTTVELIEMDDGGAEIGRQTFTLPGDVVAIDAWTVKFGFEEVADGHPLRGRTLILLRRVYSDLMRPIDGFTIDTPGGVPPAYAAGEVGRFEQRIWEHFWHLATNAEAARSLGVRVAQGEVVYKPVKAGQVYELHVDTAGGMNLTPLEPAAESEVQGVGAEEVEVEDGQRPDS